MTAGSIQTTRPAIRPCRIAGLYFFVGQLSNRPHGDHFISTTTVLGPLSVSLPSIGLPLRMATNA